MRALAWRLFALLVLCCAWTTAIAAPEAWLDRNRIALGDTVTLHVATTGNAAPDFAPLDAAGLRPHGHASQRRFELVNGQASMRTLYTVMLRPARAGQLVVPPVPVDGARTAPLALEVTAAPSPLPARAGDDVFIEAQPDDLDPYVQQSVGWIVRLYSAVPLVSGQLDQPAPRGASMQRVGDDVQYTRELDGRRYTVVERRFLLVPELSGELVVPGARFEGRGVGGFFDSVFGDRGGALAATGQPRALGVQPVPANAPTPWLPLRDLQLRYRTVPDALQAGRAASLSVELVADGAFAAQLPDLELPPIDGVQVFAEPAQFDERFVDGRPQVTLTRRFSLVPARAGPVELRALRWPWWDVDTGSVRTATLPAQRWQVRPGAASQPATGAAAPQTPGAAPADAPLADGPGRWLAIAALAVAAWLLVMAWATRRRAPADTRASASRTDARGAASGTGRAEKLDASRPVRDVEGSGEPPSTSPRTGRDAGTPTDRVAATAPAAASPTHPGSAARQHVVHGRDATAAPPAGSRSTSAPPRRAELRRALERGAVDDILAALHALAPTPAAGTEALIDRLDDPAQRAALHALQRAQWGDGDLDAARTALRRAFTTGPRWRPQARARGADPLPPLYPER